MDDTAPAPLFGIRVLDFTHVLAGPFCTRLLADLGADVVRVESSKHPDHPWQSTFVDSQGRHASYLNTNRSKRAISVDLKSEAGKKLVLRLAAVADVVIENFSAGVMRRLGLDNDTLRPLNQTLIYVSMSGYGHNGPRCDWTSMNMNLQGYSGLMMVTGSEGDPPTAISNSWNDYIGGLHACFGIIQALDERAATGKGRFLDLSQFECSVSMIGPLLLSSAVNGASPPRLGNRSMSAAPQGVYRCAGPDNWCAISVQNDEQWKALVGAMREEPWGSEARFSTVLGRLHHHDEIDQRIESWTSLLPHTEVESRLKAVSVPAEHVRQAADLVGAPDGDTVFFRMDEPRVGSMLATGMPFTLSSCPFSPPRPAPAPGQHTKEILREWLKLPDEKIEAIKNECALI